MLLRLESDRYKLTISDINGINATYCTLRLDDKTAKMIPGLGECVEKSCVSCRVPCKKFLHDKCNECDKRFLCWTE